MAAGEDGQGDQQNAPWLDSESVTACSSDDALVGSADYRGLRRKGSDPGAAEPLPTIVTTDMTVLPPMPAEGHGRPHPESVLFTPDGETDSDSADSDDDDDDNDIKEPDERWPLLRPVASHDSRHVEGARTTSPAPLYLAGVSPSRFWLIFLQILASLFIGSFDGTIMASSHPVITSYFGAANSASWLSTAFLLTSTAFQPLLGRLSDATGRKPLYMGCVVIFAMATTLCALAQSIEMFIFARALCGLGAGGTQSLGSIIISDLVPIERRSAYQSYINATFGFSSALGAALGGTMAEALGWRWEFGVQVPPLLICIGVAAFAIPRTLGVAEHKMGVLQALRAFDVKGSLLMTTSVSALILGLNLGGNVLPWRHPIVIASLSVFAVCFPSFLFVESRVSKPIMPLTLVRHSPRANLIFSGFLGALIVDFILFNVPLYFQAVLLTSATSSGLRLAFPSLITSIAGTAVGIGINRTRRIKWPLICGSSLWTVGSICLWLLRRDWSPPVYYLILLPSALGQGFHVCGTFMATLASSAQSEQAVVISTLILWRSLGMVLGVALSSLVVQNALIYYLGLYVEGPDKASVIARVRSSVEAVAKLEQPYQEQAVQSYEAALKLTFGCCIAISAIALSLVMPLKLPRLRKKD